MLQKINPAPMENLADLAGQGPMPSIPTAEAIAALRAEPRFRQAVATIIADSIEYYQGRWLAHRVLNDRARFILASIMLYLHFDRRDDVANSGLTAARLREICVGAGLCSGGRVEAVLLMMRAGGFLDRAEGGGDPHVRRYVPTAKLINLNRSRQGRALKAIDTIRGGTTYAPRICGDNELQAYSRFVAAAARGFIAGFRIVHSVPELAPIVERDAGLPLMMCVFLTSPEYAEFCPERLRNASVAEMARRFKVSRVHVRSVMRAAESLGFLLRNEETAQARVLPPLVAAIENFFATAFLYAEACAQIALAETA